ncbi:MAG: diguanylate cyclase [Rhodocyclales bacterium]|nr:diguanylate cyclase [Rhodocyclales bacterium]
MLEQAHFIELKASGNLPSPKGPALRVIELCQSDNVTLPEIIQVLQVDPATVGRILKLANSVAFGRPRPTVALTPDVLMSIGIQSVRQVVLAFSLVSGNRRGRCPGFDYEFFWSHSAATGVANQLLGAATRAAPPAELFTIGLLANVGRLALAALYPERYGELLAKAGGQFAAALTELEKGEFGYSHLDVAAAMMRDWGLPKLFTDAVLFHETPDLADSGPDSRSTRLVNCLHLGEGMADLCFVPQAERGDAFKKLLPLAQKLGVGDSSLAALGDQMLREWSEWSALLQITVHQVAPFSSLDVIAENALAAAGVDLKQLSILVVVGDPGARRMLQELLSAAGHAVHVARDGHEGLAQALQLQPQLVITDLLMPRQDSLQLIKSLRQTEFGRSIYIIVLVNADDDEILTEAFDLGADDYITRPVDGKVLQARLKASKRIINEQQLLRQEQEELRRALLQLSIANQRAQEAALTDVLTGLYNRRHAMERLAQEWAEAERGHRPLSILSLDVDHFKEVNDNHGHDVGDAALCQFAAILRAFSRAPDVPCRFGGEEFLMIAPDTSLSGAMLLAERIRSAVQHTVLIGNDASLHLTVSIGVAEKSSKHASLDQLIKSADEALYRAKQNGRNRVEKS